jgi:ABC-type polysaccharide/polyol phosphate export permease
LLQLLSFLPIVFLSLSIGCIVLFWGRGESIWGQVSSWLSFLSGAYFPVAIFPSWIRESLHFLNPFALFLEISRSALGPSVISFKYNQYFYAGSWTTLFLIALFLIHHFGMIKYRKDGPPNSYSF